MKPLSVIALISGGKDSLYSLLHCVQHGHTVIALANLHPKSSDDDAAREDEGDDLNSFMYQTVGHSIIPLYSEALQLPLYRREITGSAVETSRYYAYDPSTPPSLQMECDCEDETEDLVPLLRSVMSNHPSANALSTGAIQSTYQRTRIESIALRLGLTPLAYLWQYPILPPPIRLLSTPDASQKLREDSITGLLDDMASVGCESRIIKIASGGIKESLLWADVTASRTRAQLVAGLRKFFEAEDELGLRGAVVGEGGEFETLALCGPKSVWKGGRISINDDAVSPYSGDGGASYVRIKSAKVIKHDDMREVDEVKSGQLVPIPGLLDRRFEIVKTALLSRLRTSLLEVPVTNFATSRQGKQVTPTSIALPKMTYTVGQNSVHIANITYLDCKHDGKAHDSMSASKQMTVIASFIQSMLLDISAEYKINPPLTTSSIIATTLLLKDMADFTILNPIYASIFNLGVPNPPARVTIAAPLPDDVDVMLSFILDIGARGDRQGLHVQSRSYWAPANIGPYSQAITIPMHSHTDDDENAKPKVVYVAGQIPLVPASMDLLEGDFVDQAILSHQHLWRIGQETRVDEWTSGIVFLPQEVAVESAHEKAVIASTVWSATYAASLLDQFEEEDSETDDVDVWDLQNNHSSNFVQHTKSSLETHLRSLPKRRIISETGRPSGFLPPLIVAEVTGLPRNASSELWSTGLTGLISDKGMLSYEYGESWSSITVRHNKSRPEQWTKFLTCLLPSIDEDNIQYQDATSESLYGQVMSTNSGRLVSGTALISQEGFMTWKLLNSDSSVSVLARMCGHHIPKMKDESMSKALSVIPCHHLWGRSGSHVDVTDAELSLPPLIRLDVAVFLRIDSE